MCEISYKNSERFLRKWQKTLGDTFFAAHHSLLEYAESNWWLVICCGVHAALAIAATTNQRCQLLPMTYGNSKLSYGL